MNTVVDIETLTQVDVDALIIGRTVELGGMRVEASPPSERALIEWGLRKLTASGHKAVSQHSRDVSARLCRLNRNASQPSATT